MTNSAAARREASRGKGVDHAGQFGHQQHSSPGDFTVDGGAMEGRRRLGPSTSNLRLQNLRQAARVLGKTQSEVASNWLKTRAMTNWDPKTSGSRTEFDESMLVMRRLADAID